MVYKKISGFSDEIAPETAVQFSALNRLGIGYFEPRGIDGKNISALNEEEVRLLKANMDAAGIRVSSIGSPIGKIRITEDFQPHLKLLERTIRTAKALGSPYIRMFSFYEDGPWTEANRSEVLRRMERMLSLAVKEDIILLHENEKDIYGDTAEKCRELMDAFRCPHFGAVFDPANFVQCGEDTLKAFSLLRRDIRYVHIKDALYADGRVVPAGMGQGNVAAILKELFSQGYDGFLSLEPHLGRFEGLAELETGRTRTLMQDLPQSGEGSFILAYRALLDILNDL